MVCCSLALFAGADVLLLACAAEDAIEQQAIISCDLAQTWMPWTSVCDVCLDQMSVEPADCVHVEPLWIPGCRQLIEETGSHRF